MTNPTHLSIFQAISNCEPIFVAGVRIDPCEFGLSSERLLSAAGWTLGTDEFLLRLDAQSQNDPNITNRLQEQIDVPGLRAQMIVEASNQLSLSQTSELNLQILGVEIPSTIEGIYFPDLFELDDSLKQFEYKSSNLLGIFLETLASVMDEGIDSPDWKDWAWLFWIIIAILIYLLMLWLITLVKVVPQDSDPDNEPECVPDPEKGLHSCEDAELYQNEWNEDYRYFTFNEAVKAATRLTEIVVSNAMGIREDYNLGEDIFPTTEGDDSKVGPCIGSGKHWNIFSDEGWESKNREPLAAIKLCFCCDEGKLVMSFTISHRR